MYNMTEKENKGQNEDNKEENDKKKGVLTLPDLIMMGLGNIVGAGIFVIIGKSIKYGGNKTFLALFLVAFISLIIGCCYIEIYNRYKSNITEYLAVRNTMGEYMGEIMLYSLYFFLVFSAITIVISISKYLSTINAFSYYKNSSFFQNFISIFLLCLISFINYLGIESSKIVANTISILMIIVLSGSVLLSIRFWNLKEPFHAPNVSWDSFILSSVLSLFLFNGYDFLIKVSDESADPENNKIALISSIVITTIIYVLIIISAFCVLGYKTSGTTYNIITKIYEVLTNNYVSSVVYVIGSVIMFNTAFLTFLSANKFVQGLGRDNKIVFSDFFKQTNDYNSPSNAIFFTLAISLLFSILNNEVLMAIFSNITCILTLVLISISVLIIRWSERNNIELQEKNNFIPGNINNMPIIVIVNLCLLFYVFYEMVKNKFWIGKI